MMKKEKVRLITPYICLLYTSEAQLLLGDDVVESKAVEIDTYLFFTNDVVTRPQEEYTIRVRARWIMIVGDPDGQYM